MTLESLGWTPSEQAEWEGVDREGLVPARVTGLHRDHIVDLMTVAGAFQGRPAGRLLQGRTDPEAMPAVGDWVATDPDGTTVHEILPRRTRLARRPSSDPERVQVLAANVDVVIVVSSLNRDHELDRLARMVAMAEESGARTVVALSKSDLVDDAGPTVEQTRERFPQNEVFAFSSETLRGLDRLRQSLTPTQTVVLLGSSGVGKSTLANTLLGHERQKTAEIRGRDDRGRHATTSREMFGLPCGTLLIDTPGLRSPGLLVEDPSDDRDEAEADREAEIERLAAGCRFRDCRHETEPGCAVRAAIEAGELPPG